MIMALEGCKEQPSAPDSIVFAQSAAYVKYAPL